MLKTSIRSLPFLIAVSCGGEKTAPEPPRAQILLLDEEPIAASSRPQDEQLAQHLALDELWVLNEPLAADSWREDPDVPGVLRHGLRFSVAGEPRVYSVGGPLDRTNSQLVGRTDLVPRAGELVLERRNLRRLASDEGFVATEIAYPVERSALNTIAGLPGPHGTAQPSQMRLDGVNQRGLAAAVPSLHSYALQLPLDAHLDASVAVRRAELRAFPDGLSLRLEGEASIAFRVVLELEDGTRENLWSATLGVDDREHLHSLRLDLSRWSGQFVRLHLETDFQDPNARDDWSPFIVWCEPVIWSAAPSEQPNVLVVLLDTLRADRLGCYGSERARTPRLDALAARGVRYVDAMSAASWTLPAHASLFTSTFPSQHGLWNDQRLPAELTTIAEHLQAGGYRTSAFTEGGFLKEAHGFARGFEVFDGKRRDCTLTFERARLWITERRAPYFAFVQTYKVHSPYTPSAETRAQFVGDYRGRLPETVDVRDYPWGRNGAPPNAEDQRYVSDLYDAEIAELDSALGDFLEQLESAGALDNTLLIVTSDHGEEFFEHGGTLHGMSLYQEQLHVPLILYWKGHFEGGEVIERPVHLVDLAPTVVAAAGLEAPANWVGELLGVATGLGNRPLYFPMRTRWTREDRQGIPATALREGDWKYIEYPSSHRAHDPQGGAGLFNLAQDPLEQRDVLNAENRAEWQNKIRALRERYGVLGTADTFELDEAALRELEELGYVGED